MAKQTEVKDNLVVVDGTQVTIVEVLVEQTLIKKLERHIKQLRIRTEMSEHQMSQVGKFLKDETYWWYNQELDRWVGLKNKNRQPYTLIGRWILVCLSYNGKPMLGLGGE